MQNLEIYTVELIIAIACLSCFSVSKDGKNTALRLFKIAVLDCLFGVHNLKPPKFYNFTTVKMFSGESG